MILDERARWFGFFLLDRLRGGKVRQYYDDIRRSYREGTSLQETDEKIRRLIAHARATAEFYKDIPENASLSDMPIVNKDTFRNHYDAFISSEFADRKGCREMSTSGSTGTPLTVIQNSDKIAHDTAEGIFFGAMAGYYIGMKMGFLRVWVNNVKKGKLRLLAENMIMVDTSDLSDEGCRKMLDMFRKKRVKALVGYASSLGELSRYIDRNHVDTSGFAVRSIIPISESMPTVTRKRLSEQFSCPVQAWYSNEENGIMGVQPPDGDSYYIDTENYYYEILKMDSDESAAPGEPGRIVITDLNNYAFPIIRYDNGDIAVAERKQNGDRYRLILKELYGRRSDTIYDTEGNALTPYVITNNLWDVEGVRQYQFIQNTETVYTLRLNGDREKMDMEDILGRIRPYFGENADIRIEFVDEIPVLNSGKRKYIQNLCEKYAKQ